MIKTSCLLPHRGVITITGADRVTFLQGLVSNNVRHATTQQAVYAALLTPQGKFLHDMFILASDDTLWLDVEAARADDLITKLTKYKLRSDVIIHNCTADYGVGILLGDPSDYQTQTSFTFSDPRQAALGWRMIAPRDALPPADTEAFAAYDRLRLSLGVPDGSRDMSIGQTILLEANFDRLNGVDFTKGCYMGQELTARTHYRALLKKRFFPVTISGPAPAFGTPILLGETEIGTMLSSQGDKGLAMLKIEAVTAGAVFNCGGAELSVPSAPQAGGLPSDRPGATA